MTEEYALKYYNTTNILNDYLCDKNLAIVSVYEYDNLLKWIARIPIVCGVEGGQEKYKVYNTGHAGAGPGSVLKFDDTGESYWEDTKAYTNIFFDSESDMLLFKLKYANN